MTDSFDDFRRVLRLFGWARPDLGPMFGLRDGTVRSLLDGSIDLPPELVPWLLEAEATIPAGVEAADLGKALGVMMSSETKLSGCMARLGGSAWGWAREADASEPNAAERWLIERLATAPPVGVFGVRWAERAAASG